jgi:2-iminobutanoate/2-iminopropanoate deaminase
MTFTAQGAKQIGPYAQAVDGGSFVFLSGQIPVDPVTNALVDGDIAAQTQQVLANIAAILKAADLTFDDVIKSTVFMTDLSEFKSMNEIYAQAFAAPYPARSTVQVAALPLGAKVEIEVIAKKA